MRWKLFETKQKLEDIKNYQEAVHKPFILDAGTLNNEIFNVEFTDLEYSHKHDIFKYFEKITGKSNIWDIVEMVCNKDEEWIRQRNKNLTGVFFHKYVLKSEYINGIKQFLDHKEKEYLAEIDALERKTKQLEDEKAKRKASFNIIKVYKDIKASGGENGTDGLLDIDIENSLTSKITRVIARNVFDFGYYSYPYRVNGTDNVFNRENWTEEEKLVCKWVDEFGNMCKGIRM